jgi:hypothetical protein
MQSTERHLTSLPPLPALRRAEPRIRRPGERREPLDVEVPAAFAAAAATLGISLAAAVEIAFECELVKEDIAQLGRGDEFHALVLTAAGARVAVPTAPTYARYLRALAGNRANTVDEADRLEEPVDLPLRLFPRVLEITPDAALREDRLRQGVALERAAVCAGRTMSEYAFFALARR